MSIPASETESLKRASSRANESEPKWLRRQRRLFTNFCNAKLADRDDIPPMTDILEDIKDGRVLYALLEVLSGQSLAPLGKIKKPKAGKELSHIDKVANLSISFRYIHQTTKIVGIGPGDVADGHSSLVLGLIWSLIVFFTAKDLGGLDDVSALKKKILKWCQKRTEKNPDVEIKNLKDSFMGGNAFLAILHDVDPVGSPYEPTSSASKNYQKAFDDAAEKYGVPQLLDANDEDLWKDDQSMVTYLSELMKRLPEHGGDKAAGPLRWANENEPKAEDDLVQLCKIPSVPDDPNHLSDCQHCANVLKDLASNKNLKNVQLILPDDKSEISSPPFVVASLTAEPQDSVPTVLLVADYGVEDGSYLTANWGGDGSAFIPIYINEGTNKRLRAAGSASSKSGCLALIQSMAALINGKNQDQDKFPLNIDLILACGEAKDYAPNGRIQQFVTSQYANKKAPDYALVDAPGIAPTLTPDTYTVAFSCRGYIELEICVTIAQDKEATKNKKGGYALTPPLIDANMGLCQVIAGLRQVTEGKTNPLMKIPGLLGFTSSNRFTKALEASVQVSPEQLSQDVGYYPNPLAVMPSKTLPEQLCFQPGFTIIDWQQDTLPIKNDIGSLFPSTSARARLCVFLAPGFSHDKAITLLENAAKSAAEPWNLNLEIQPSPSPTTGYISELADSFLNKFTISANRHFANKRAVKLIASPAFVPLTTAVSRALAATGTYGIGINDQQANLAKINESVKLSDMHDSVKSLISLLANMNAVPKFQKSVDVSSLFEAP